MVNIPTTEKWPTYDGDLMIYQTGTSEKLVPPMNTNLYTIYVNGMATAAGDFKYQCLNLSKLFSCRIGGVFNQSNGGLLDVAQCISDYKYVCAQEGFTSFSTFLGGTILSVFGPGSNTNPATSRLFEVLATYGSMWPSKPICIIAHSQGNLIASGALYTLAAWLKMNGLPCPAIKVFALASPAPAWPQSQLSNLSVKPYTNLDDPIPYLSVLRSFSGNIEVTGLAGGELTFDAHDLNTYEANSVFVCDLRRTLFPSWHWLREVTVVGKMKLPLDQEYEAYKEKEKIKHSLH